MSAITGLQFSLQPVTRRVEAMAIELNQKLKPDIAECKYFPLQFDESIDVVEITKLCIYIRMA